jgi:hypothetical protein
MTDFVPPIQPPIPEPPEPSARIALWHWADDYFEDYLVSAVIWRENMRSKYPEQYSRSEKEIIDPGSSANEEPHKNLKNNDVRL